MELKELGIVELFELRHSVNKTIAEKEKARFDYILESRKRVQDPVINLTELVDYIIRINEVDIRNPRRYEKFTFPRFSFFLIMNMDYNISLMDLSREFNCHHTSVLNGINVALGLLDSRNHDKYARFLEAYSAIKVIVLDYLNKNKES